MNPYDYPRDKPKFNLHLRQTTRMWLHYAVDFPIAQPTGYTEYDTARGEYFRPRKNHQGPLVILAHGWGDSSVIPCKLLARALVKKGIACFILYQAFHSSRIPEVIKNKTHQQLKYQNQSYMKLVILHPFLYLINKEYNMVSQSL